MIAAATARLPSLLGRRRLLLLGRAIPPRRRLLLGWARGASSPPGAAPVAAAASSFILVHHRRYRHQDVQPSGLPGSQSRRELVHSLRYGPGPPPARRPRSAARLAGRRRRRRAGPGRGPRVERAGQAAVPPPPGRGAGSRPSPLPGAAGRHCPGEDGTPRRPEPERKKSPRCPRALGSLAAAPLPTGVEGSTFSRWPVDRRSPPARPVREGPLRDLSLCMLELGYKYSQAGTLGVLSALLSVIALLLSFRGSWRWHQHFS